MKVSIQAVKQFTKVNLSTSELIQKINSQLGAIEDVIHTNDVYKDARIVKVVSAEKHPAADRLQVTRIDDGGQIKDVERDDDGLVQVVCGAPNVAAGMFAVWLPPRSVVPATYHDDDPFILGARELRGVMSQGMLAAADELAIGTDHEGILEINPGEWKPSELEITPGVLFADVYGLNDTVIDIENKMFTHRPDLFGQLGVAREIAGIQQQPFISPSWYSEAPTFTASKLLSLHQHNDAPEKVPRFMTVAIKGVEVKPSPLWLQCALVAMGSKPINNIVDVTNYIMLITSQPTHAYDYDLLRGNKITARMAATGETLTLLNQKTYTLSDDDIVIADSEGAIGLAGIMGGGNSEVSENTTNIVLEVATFDMYALRKTSMRHGLFTDALTRFNKGQSPRQNDYVMALLIKTILDVSPGEVASDVSDMKADSARQTVHCSAAFINERLGLDLTSNEIARLLTNVEFDVEASSDSINITVPFWRTDISLPEDVVEEVGRLYSFDELPRELPMRSSMPVQKNAFRSVKQGIRSSLTRFGANEVLTYSFVHEKVLTKATQNPALAYKLSNALSPDLQYYRLSITPSLLDKTHMNIKAGYSSFALYEFGKAHMKEMMSDDEPSVPEEVSTVAMIVTDKKATDAAYFMAKRYAQTVLGNASEYQVVPLQEAQDSLGKWQQQLVAPYEPARSAVIRVGDAVIGVVGEFKHAVRSAFKLPQYTAGFEFDMSHLQPTLSTYKPLSKYPEVTQDLSLVVDANTRFDQLYSLVQDTLQKHEDMQCSITPLSVYQATDNTAVKTISFRITALSYTTTLRDKDVTSLLDSVVAAAAEKLNATRG